MEVSAQPRRRWTRAEYARMFDAGILHPDERIELLDGEVVPMTPQKSLHAATVQALTASLIQAIGPTLQVRVQLPLALGDYSEPEPDLAVVPGDRWDYLDQHPHTALLIIEVADTSLGTDRLRKGPLYARAGIQDYWIIDLVADAVEVCRDPGPDGYRSVERLARGETIRPLARPSVTIAVADLLPPP